MKRLLVVVAVVMVLSMVLSAIPASAMMPGPGPMPMPGPGPYYFVRPGDTLSAIAWRFGTSVWAIARANGIPNPNLIYVGQRLLIPGGGSTLPGGVWYTVRPGDTLSSIAWRYGVSVWTLAKVNNISNPNLIYAGQKLYIP